MSRNQPRYRNCESCWAEGRKTRATWICLECSNMEQRGVLVCEEGLAKEHEDHFAEESLY